MPVESIIVLLLNLIAGIQAIQPQQQPIPIQRAELYARAAIYHGVQRSVDPFELLALARNESDFNERAVGPDGLDCGMTQTRITYSRYSCKELQRSPWLAFAEAARELHAYAESCRGHEDYDRCRLNRYNSGQNYARRGAAGRYYLRVRCFAEAARRQLLLGDHCRSVRTPEELALLIGTASSAGSARRIAPISPARHDSARTYAAVVPVRAGSAADRHPPAWADSLLVHTMSELQSPALPADDFLLLNPRARVQSWQRRRRQRRRPQPKLR